MRSIFGNRSEPPFHPHSGASFFFKIHQGQERRPRQTPCRIAFSYNESSPSELTQGSPTMGPEAEMIMALAGAFPKGVARALIFSDYEQQSEPG